MVNQDKFSFKPISKLDIEKVQPINPQKSSSGNIPLKKLKISSKVSADVLQNLFNDMLKTGNFPDNRKLADTTPVFKRKILCTKSIINQLIFCLHFKGL